MGVVWTTRPEGKKCTCHKWGNTSSIYEDTELQSPAEVKQRLVTASQPAVWVTLSLSLSFPPRNQTSKVLLTTVIYRQRRRVQRNQQDLPESGKAPSGGHRQSLQGVSVVRILFHLNTKMFAQPLFTQDMSCKQIKPPSYSPIHPSTHLSI